MTTALRRKKVEVNLRSCSPEDVQKIKEAKDKELKERSEPCGEPSGQRRTSSQPVDEDEVDSKLEGWWPTGQGPSGRVGVHRSGPAEASKRLAQLQQRRKSVAPLARESVGHKDFQGRHLFGLPPERHHAGEEEDLRRARARTAAVTGNL